MINFGSEPDGREPPMYGDNRHGGLPWGYWLISIGDTPGEPPLEDECGNVWGSVRDVFWFDRLGLTRGDPRRMTSCLEFLMSYLAIIDERFVGFEERTYDLFNSSPHLDEFLINFLKSKGLIEDREFRSRPRPTAEGRAVVAMLIATRDRGDAAHNVGLDWIEATSGLARGPDRRRVQNLVQEREEAASRMAYRFATGQVDNTFTVNLIGLKITPTIPVRSTLWSLDFPDQYARDRFYLWLLEHIDRWDKWSDLVIQQGARALTEYLMRLAFCDRFAEVEG